MEKLGDTASGRTGSPGRPGRRTVMSNHPFRFGASLFNVGSRSAWRDHVREVEDLGYDVLQVPDHLGMPSSLAPRICPGTSPTCTASPTAASNWGSARGISRASSRRQECHSAPEAN